MALDRRQFLAGMGAAGAAMLARLAEAQQAAGGRLFRIDTHAHFTIPKMYDLATAHGVQQATLKDWSPAKMLAEMEEGGVATSILSISDPGVNFGDNMAARALIWSYGGSIQDERETVVINSPQTIDAVDYMARLFKATMTDEVFGWNAASNNQGLIAGNLSYILNSISAYRSAQTANR